MLFSVVRGERVKARRAAYCSAR